MTKKVFLEWLKLFGLISILVFTFFCMGVLSFCFKNEIKHVQANEVEQEVMQRAENNYISANNSNNQVVEETYKKTVIPEGPSDKKDANVSSENVAFNELKIVSKSRYIQIDFHVIAKNNYSFKGKLYRVDDYDGIYTDVYKLELSAYGNLFGGSVDTLSVGLQYNYDSSSYSDPYVYEVNIKQDCIVLTVNSLESGECIDSLTLNYFNTSENNKLYFKDILFNITSEFYNMCECTITAQRKYTNTYCRFYNGESIYYEGYIASDKQYSDYFEPPLNESDLSLAFKEWAYVATEDNVNIYRAVFEEAYYVRFYDETGELISEEKVPKFTEISSIKKPKAPIKEYHTFETWQANVNDDILLQDVSFTPIYKRNETTVTIKYWTIERFDFKEDKSIMGFINTLGDKIKELFTGEKAHRYADCLTKKTITKKVYEGEELDFDSLIGNGLYGKIAYKNIPGWEFVGWNSKENQNIATKENNIFETVYEIPNIKVSYYSSNNVKVFEDEIKLEFAPIPEIERNINLWDGFTKYWNDIVVNWDIGALIDDATARDLAKTIVKGLSDKFIADEQELYFMIVRPDIKIDAAYGLFKESAAICASSTFKYLMGQAKYNDFVYFAELTPIYINGIKYEMIVTYDTPYDKIVIWGKEAWNNVSKFFSNSWWKILLFILIPLTIWGIFVVTKTIIKNKK